VTQANHGTCFNVNNFTASDAKSGQSVTTLDITSAAETKMFRVVRSAEVPNQEDLANAGADIVVVMNGAANLYR
jgi:hypothetical protein